MSIEVESEVVLPSSEPAESPSRVTTPLFNDELIQQPRYHSLLIVPGGLVLTACFFLFWARVLDLPGLASYDSPLLVLVAVFGLGVSVVSLIRERLGSKGQQAFDWLLAMLWCSAAIGVALTLRSSLLQDDLVDRTRLPFVIAWLALTYLGSLALLPSFPQSRRPGRLTWTGASLMVLLLGLLVLETLAPTFDVRLSTVVAIALCGPSLTMASILAFADRPKAKPRSLGLRLAWTYGLLVVLGLLAFIIGPLMSVAGLWVAILASTALFTGGATAEWEAADAHGRQPISTST